MKNNRLLPLGLILLVAVLALFVPAFRTFVREIIVIPILYVFWVGRFLFLTIPQTLLWHVFFAVFLLIMAVGLIERKKPQPQKMNVKEDYPGRIEAWAGLINKASQHNYFKWRLAQRLQKVTLRAIAHNKGQTVKQTRRQLREGALNLPSDLHAYFLASVQSLSHLSPQKRFFATRPKPSPLDLDLHRVIQFLDTLYLDTTPTAHYLVESAPTGQADKEQSPLQQNIYTQTQGQTTPKQTGDKNPNDR